MKTSELTGHEAIAYAEAHGLTLDKATDPTEEARPGLSVDEARRVAAEDPSLISLPLDAAEEERWNEERVERAGEAAGEVYLAHEPVYEVRAKGYDPPEEVHAAARAAYDRAYAGVGIEASIVHELRAELERIGAEPGSHDGLDVEVRGDVAVVSDAQIVARHDAQEALASLQLVDAGEGDDGAWQALARLDEQERELVAKDASPISLSGGACFQIDTDAMPVSLPHLPTDRAVRLRIVDVLPGEPDRNILDELSSEPPARSSAEKVRP
jgi:hypothetical protein